MKILIPTVGTRGDIQPYIALANGLKASGHRVTLASHPSMGWLAHLYGVSFAPIGPDIDMGLETQAIRNKSRNWILAYIRLMQYSVSIVEQCHNDILSLCQDTDLVIVSHSFAGRAEADKLNLPVASVTLQHQSIPTPSQSRIRRTAAGFMGSMKNPVMLGPYNKLRRKVGLASIKGIEELMSPILNMIPVSPNVVSPDPRWNPQHKITGYWFLGEPASWKPPSDLEEFLATGDLPVAISLGAMSLDDDIRAEESAHIILEGIKKAGVRAIVQGWDKVLSRLTLPEGVCPCNPIPHSWLFQRVQAVVHHGGFGTTAASLRAGIPEIVLPHVIDQYYWGERVRELGVGPKPIPRDKWDASIIAAAIQEAVSNKEIRQQSIEIGNRIRQECGICSAVHLIEEEWGRL